MKELIKKTNADWPQLTNLFLDYRKGDEKAASEFFETLQRIYLGFYKARMMNSPEIQDMVQTTLLKVHFGRNGFDEKLSLKTWIFTIANRALIDHWRGSAKDKTNLQDLSNEVTENAQAIENIAKDETLFEDFFRIQVDLQNALNKLKPFERSIVYLYGIEGMSMGEIAKIHNSTEGAIKVRVHRAYVQLKGLMISFLLFLLTKGDQ